MEQFLISALPYFAWGAAAFNAFCLAVVIHNGRKADAAMAAARKELDKLRSLLRS